MARDGWALYSEKRKRQAVWAQHTASCCVTLVESPALSGLSACQFGSPALHTLLHCPPHQAWCPVLHRHAKRRNRAALPVEDWMWRRVTGSVWQLVLRRR